MDYLFLLSFISFISFGFAFDPQFYPNTAKLSEDYHIYWKVENDKVRIALQVETVGWVGFGLGEPSSGSMPGADIITAHVEDNNVVKIVDRYALGKYEPLVDDCQHWELIGGFQNDTYTIIEVERKLDTGDAQDRQIVPGPTKIIWAFGDTDTFTYHSQRGIGAVEFITSDIEIPDVDDLPSATFSTPTTIPTDATSYYCVGYNLPTLDEDAHIVSMQIILDENVANHVHHIIVHIFDDTTWFNQHYQSPKLCNSPVAAKSTGCSSI